MDRDRQLGRDFLNKGPEINAASGGAAIALLLGVLALVSERRRRLAPQIGHD